jgi:hypothetical protein
MGVCRHDRTCRSLGETSAAISGTIPSAIGASSQVMVPPRRAGVRLGGSHPRTAGRTARAERSLFRPPRLLTEKTQPSSRAEPEVQRTGPHRQIGPQGQLCRNPRADAAGPMGSARAACAGKFPPQVTLLNRSSKERDIRGEFLLPTSPFLHVSPDYAHAAPGGGPMPSRAISSRRRRTRPTSITPTRSTSLAAGRECRPAARTEARERDRHRPQAGARTFDPTPQPHHRQIHWMGERKPQDQPKRGNGFP